MSGGIVNTGPEEGEGEDKIVVDVKKQLETFELYDMHRPIEGDCLLEILDFTDNLGKMVLNYYIFFLY